MGDIDWTKRLKMDLRRVGERFMRDAETIVGSDPHTNGVHIRIDIEPDRFTDQARCSVDIEVDKGFSF